jgi:hypothetical protein
VHHLKGDTLFPCRLFLVAGHLSCDASSIGGTARDFSRKKKRAALHRALEAEE